MKLPQESTELSESPLKHDRVRDMRLIKDRYRLDCLTALNSFGATYTYCVKNIVKQKVKSEVRTDHILQNLKQLEKDGYVKGEKSGLSWFWILTKSGREFSVKVDGGQ